MLITRAGPAVNRAQHLKTVAQRIAAVKDFAAEVNRYLRLLSSRHNILMLTLVDTVPDRVRSLAQRAQS
eukprot:882019-Pyramimonas_sp.AAC.1